MEDILIHKVGAKYAVRQGSVEIGRWTDIRKAKACRGALDVALRTGSNPVLAVGFALIASNDDGVVNSYTTQEDETVRYG